MSDMRREGDADGTQAAGGQLDAGRYEIRLKGHLAARWAIWFDGMSLAHESDGTTVVSGVVVDQSALHGLLNTVRDLGLVLVSVTQIHPNSDSNEETRA